MIFQKPKGKEILSLSGEARLWYETLNAQQQQLDWAGLQECFRQQYSSLTIPENSISMHGDLFILMKQPTL